MSNTYRIGVIGFCPYAHQQPAGPVRLPIPESVLVVYRRTLCPSAPIPAKPALPANGTANAGKRLALPKLYDDYREMLAQEQFDVIICCAENNQHGTWPSGRGCAYGSGKADGCLSGRGAAWPAARAAIR